MNDKRPPRQPMKPTQPSQSKAKPVHKMDETDKAAHREAALEPQAKAAAARKREEAAASAPPTGVQHTVASGETLSHISEKYYKTPNRWKEIYEANKAVIGDNPGLIKPGQVLNIPGVTA